MTSNQTNVRVQVTVFDLQEALRIVRAYHPNAVREGSTFDWSYWVDGKVVAIAQDVRRSKKPKWRLTVYRNGQD